MFLKKLHKFIAIILTFLSFSFNLNGQISDNFLLLYDSYDKLNNIEQVIKGSENRIVNNVRDAGESYYKTYENIKKEKGQS